LNSAIEACVDLITNEWHEKAKIAKDCASAAVFFSVLLALFVWGFILYNIYL
ncbi:diacylglycerol kinase, partial [Campylobacter jejuni]